MGIKLYDLVLLQKDGDVENEIKICELGEDKLIDLIEALSDITTDNHIRFHIYQSKD